MHKTIIIFLLFLCILHMSSNVAAKKGTTGNRVYGWGITGRCISFLLFHNGPSSFVH